MVYTGLSGNEIYCLAQKGYRPGDLVIGNSVFAMGFIGGIRSGIRGFLGGEIKQYTDMIGEGRRLSLERLQKEVDTRAGVGATGITSELVMHPGNIEFLSVGSTLHTQDDQSQGGKMTSSADGQELYCQIDANFSPLKFVFGNVAYSIGFGRGFMGGIKTLARGEVHEYTDIFNQTRNLALERIVADAKTVGANSIVGIRTTIIPFASVGVQEMLMIGTASNNPVLPQVYQGDVVTSDLTCEEMWNLTNMGYIPQKLLLGTSVYSLGFIGGVASMFKSFVRGEISQLTSLIYDAREKSLEKIAKEAEAIGADDVVGVKTYVYSLGNGLLEFLAIGTAVKHIGDQVKTQSPQLIPQAIIKDKDTFYNSAELSFGFNLNDASR